MGNTHSQAAEKFVLRGVGVGEGGRGGSKHTAFLTVEVLLTLFHFSGGLVSVLLLPATSGQWQPRRTIQTGGMLLFVSLLSLFFCFIFLLFYRHQNENSAQDIACIKQPMLLSEPEHWAFTDSFHQTDPELWQPRKYS